MNRLKIFFLFLLVFPAIANAQHTYAVTDPYRSLKQAIAITNNEQYALAYPLLYDLRQVYSVKQPPVYEYFVTELQYHLALCGLKLMKESAREDAEIFIETTSIRALKEPMAFHLGHYLFLQKEYEEAIRYYTIAGIEHLDNEQIADLKFEKAYALFARKSFDLAKPLFDEMHQMENTKYYIPANYYYGFICYKDKQYEEALESFKRIENDEAYASVVPYYIAEIYYFQGKKDESVAYGETILAKGSSLYYDKQLRLLSGQLYFEKKSYAKALPLLESYVSQSEKVSKEVLYELSYCYYKEGRNKEAMDGFKQLSEVKDSMGQNSMYLLGDLYLKAGQKANARNAFQYCALNGSNEKQQQESRFNYAKLSYELGFQDVALKEMKSFLADYPGSSHETEAREIMVSIFANTNNFADALSLFETIEKPGPQLQQIHARILYGKSIEFINDQQPDKAEPLLDQIIKLGNDNRYIPYANFWKGEFAFRRKNYDESIQYHNRFLSAKVSSQGEVKQSSANYTLGYCQMNKENFKAALSHFELVSTKTSASLSIVEQDAFLRSADCYYMLRDFSKATSMYDQVIQQALSQSDYAMYQKAMIGGIKSSKEKINQLQLLVRQYPASPLVADANLEIAQTYISDEQFNQSVPYLEKIIQSTDEGFKPKAYLKLGQAYYNSNNNKSALNVFNDLIVKYPQSLETTEAIETMRDIYMEEGKPEAYVDMMKKQGIPIDTDVADSLMYAAAFTRFNSGNCELANTSFSNYIIRYPDGKQVVDAIFYRAECFRKKSSWTEALTGYDQVIAKGLNPYFEQATLEAARINYFEVKSYAKAKQYFELLQKNAINQENQLEALRGLVRTNYLMKDYVSAKEIANDLLSRKGLNTDDKTIGYLVLGKSQQSTADYTGALSSFKSAAAINKSAWGAEARYEIAACYFSLNNLTAAEKAAMTVIRETGSYDQWVTQSYLLLGDIFMQQKDFFNAKATYESVANNASIAELKLSANQKLEQAITAEKQQSKLGN